ncbi:MAG: CNNM domain-containing protein [Christensenellaceae bacterium]
MDIVPLSIVIVILVLLSGFFSGTETAFSCANKLRLKNMVALGKKHAKAVYTFAEEKYDKLVTAILIGNNIVNLTASAIGTVVFGKLLIDSFARLDDRFDRRHDCGRPRRRNYLRNISRALPRKILLFLLSVDAAFLLDFNAYQLYLRRL